MIGLLLRLYPARWRARYGDEFELILADRPLGPFDVADVLLGALDAHLHLRGLGAASEHRKGFAMSVRIGGWAAIVGGVGWFAALLGSALANGENSGLWAALMLAATLALLVGLIGLSAFQARRDPRLVWAAFTVPAAGAWISIVGLVAMGVVGDRRFVGDLSPWYVWMIGVLTLLVGSLLFAVATLRTNSLSRAAAGLLGVGSLAVVPVLAGITGALGPEPVGILISVVSMASFSAGWVALGASALRAGFPVPTTLEGAAA